MDAWWTSTKTKDILGCLFLSLLELEELCTLQEADRLTESLLKNVPLRAVENAERLLKEVISAYGRLRFSRLNVPHEELRIALNRIHSLAESLKAYANPKLRFRKEDYPLLHSYMRIKRMLTRKDASEAQHRLYDNFLLLVPFIILSFRAWVKELKRRGYMDRTETKEEYLLARGLEFLFASLREPISEENFKIGSGKTLALKYGFIREVLDSIFFVKEGQIAFLASTAEILRVKKFEYKREYVFSLKRALHEVLSGGISKRRRKIRPSAQPAKEPIEGSTKSRKDEKVDYEASKEWLRDYMLNYYREINFSLDVDFLDDLTPMDRAIKRILRDLEFVVKLRRKEDYEAYSVFENEITQMDLVTDSGVDAFYKYLASLIYWKNATLTDYDVFLTSAQIKKTYEFLINSLEKLSDAKDPSEKNLHTLLTLTALSIATGIDLNILTSRFRLSAPAILEPFYFDTAFEEGQEARDFLGVREVLFVKDKGILEVHFLRRNPGTKPLDIFHETKDYWIAPVPDLLLPHLDTIFKEYPEPMIIVRGRRVKIDNVHLGGYLKALTKVLVLPFILTPAILRKTVIYELTQRGSPPLLAYLLSGRLPLSFHAPFFYLNTKRKTVWKLLLKWQKFLTGDITEKPFPEDDAGRFGTKLYPKDEVVRDNIKFWFSALKWSRKKRLRDLEIKILNFLNLYLLLTFSGLRIGEALKLRWQDLAFNIKLRDLEHPVGLAHIQGKSNIFYLEERLVPLSPLVFHSLQYFKNFLKRRRLLNDWVFRTNDSRPYEYDTLRREITEVEKYLDGRKIAGKYISTLRFHIFRHYFFSKTLENFPKDFETIEAILGHRGGTNIYLWKYSNRSLKDLLEKSMPILEKLERKVLGKGLRQELMVFMGGPYES